MSAVVELSPDAKRLKGLRLLIEGCDIAAMMLGAEPEGMAVVVTRENGTTKAVARFLGPASSTDMELLADAYGTATFLLRLLDRAFEEIRDLKSSTGGGARDSSAPPLSGKPLAGTPNFAAEAAIKCSEPAFKRFLMDRHGLESPATDEACATKLRHMLGVKSRAEINTDEAVAARWARLKQDFKAWRYAPASGANERAVR